MDEFARLVNNELCVVRTHHTQNMVSLHEAYAVILEEVDELWDEARKKNRDRKDEDVLTELVQIAAMCQRAAEDLNLV